MQTLSPALQECGSRAINCATDDAICSPGRIERNARNRAIGMDQHLGGVRAVRDVSVQTLIQIPSLLMLLVEQKRREDACALPKLARNQKGSSMNFAWSAMRPRIAFIAPLKE
jgi:hypothetical protein